jgi:hypothetical protein
VRYSVSVIREMPVEPKWSVVISARNAHVDAYTAAVLIAQLPPPEMAQRGAAILPPVKRPFEKRSSPPFGSGARSQRWTLKDSGHIEKHRTAGASRSPSYDTSNRVTRARYTKRPCLIVRAAVARAKATPRRFAALTRAALPTQCLRSDSGSGAF